MSGYRSSRAYGGYGYRPARSAPASAGQRSPRSAWLAFLDFVALAADNPTDRPLDLMHAMRGLTAASFPAERGDTLAHWGKLLLERARLWAESGEARRTAFAAGLKADAVKLKDLLIDQGAAAAVASRERMGFKED